VVRSVLHLTGSFVEASQAWLYDIITAPGSFEASVHCEKRLNSTLFPFDEVWADLPSSRRFGRDWVTRQVNARTAAGVAPRNYWRRVLRGLAPRADVVHAHFGHFGWMAIDAGLSPVVVSFYGFDAYSRQWLSHWGRVYPALFARGASFVAEGPAMAERLIQLGAARERVRVLPLMADVTSLNWRPPRPDGPLHILMAGRLVEKKGFRLGLEAFARLGLRGATLTIVGSGPEEQALKRAVARHAIPGVRFVPFVSRREYRALISDSDILLQPSVTARNGDSEGGAPTVLFDAQAIGVVIVASDHADIPYVVDTGAAYLSREGDVEGLSAALAAAVDGRGEWRDRSLAGRQHVEDQHGPRQVAARRDEIYAEATQFG